VGGAAFDAALRACNPGARLLPLGFASGTVPQIPANILLVKNLTVYGLYWTALAKLRPQLVSDSIAALFGWYAQGRLHPQVSYVLPLEEAEAGLDLLRQRRATGKVVVRVS
jgi:NADPH2:quinone reductase